MQLGEALVDLSALSLRVGCGLELSAVGRLDPALERERAPAAGGPGVARAVARPVPVRGAGDAEDVADDHRAPRDGRLPDRGHGADALLDGAGLLGIEADEEAWAVHEIDDRQVEGLRQIDEALDLPAGVGRPGVAIEEGIARKQRLHVRGPMARRCTAPGFVDTELMVTVTRPPDERANEASAQPLPSGSRTYAGLEASPRKRSASWKWSLMYWLP